MSEEVLRENNNQQEKSFTAPDSTESKLFRESWQDSTSLRSLTDNSMNPSSPAQSVLPNLEITGDSRSLNAPRNSPGEINAGRRAGQGVDSTTRLGQETLRQAGQGSDALSDGQSIHFNTQAISHPRASLQDVMMGRDPEFASNFLNRYAEASPEERHDLQLNDMGAQRLASLTQQTIQLAANPNTPAETRESARQFLRDQNSNRTVQGVLNSTERGGSQRDRDFIGQFNSENRQNRERFDGLLRELPNAPTQTQITELLNGFSSLAASDRYQLNQSFNGLDANRANRLIDSIVQTASRADATGSERGAASWILGQMWENRSGRVVDQLRQASGGSTENWAGRLYFRMRR